MNDLVAVERQGGALALADMKHQVQVIQQVMKEVMKPDVHYGTVPGTNKPSLYKAGAEKLCMVFRLGPDYEVVDKERDGDHLTITSKCTLTHIPSGQKFGSALGSCSTMESKYAYRKGVRVCPECAADAIIKGKAEYGGGWLCFKSKGGCGAKFADGAPEIEKQEVGRVANEDKADQYNTVLKMSNKRALLAAVLNATAASDIFEQDLIEDVQGGVEVTPAGEDAQRNQARPAPRKVKEPQAKTEKKPGPQQEGAINATQASIVRKTLERSGKLETGLCEHFGVKTLEELPAAKINDAIDFAKGE